MLDDPLALLPHEVLRARLQELVAESCAWAVGLSDAPHAVRRQGRAVPSGVTLGVRAATGQPLAADDERRLDLLDARPGSFRDALGALAPGGGVHADRYEADVLRPFVDATCTAAAERARAEEPQAWAELLDDLGEDGDDLLAVARASDWDSALRAEAEDLALAALGDLPLAEVEAEGLPLSVVRAAEAQAAGSAPVLSHDAPRPDDALAGSLFLARAALADAALPLPIAPTQSPALLEVLLDAGIEPDEVLPVVEELPVTPDGVEEVALLLEVARLQDGP